MINPLQARLLASKFLDETFYMIKGRKLKKPSKYYHKKVDQISYLIYWKCRKDNIRFSDIYKNVSGYVLGWFIKYDKIQPTDLYVDWNWIKRLTVKSINFGNIKINITGDSAEEALEHSPKSLLNEIAIEYPLHDIPEEVEKGYWSIKYIDNRNQEPVIEGNIIY